MTSALDKSTPVSQPYYEKIDDGSDNPIAITDKAMYNWMSIRAAGPNVLASTNLLGNTVINGYVNSNDKEGTQPAGESGTPQNDPDALGPPQKSDKFVWDYGYRILTVQGNDYEPADGVNGVYYNGIYNLNWQVLYVNVQSAPEPIDALGVDTSVVYGTTQIEMHLKIQGQIKMVESKPSVVTSAFPALANADPATTDYMDTGYLVIQPNFNKWAQLNQYSLVATVSSNINNGTFAPPTPGNLLYYAPGGSVVANFVQYDPTGGSENGLLTLAFAYPKPTAASAGGAWDADNYYSLDVVVDMIMISNDNLPANT